MIWSGISMFEAAQQACATAQRFARLGQFVARVELEPDYGFSFETWGSAGHMSVWGEPARFRAAVADIVHISLIDMSEAQ